MSTSCPSCHLSVVPDIIVAVMSLSLAPDWNICPLDWIVVVSVILTLGYVNYHDAQYILYSSVDVTCKLISWFLVREPAQKQILFLIT